MDASTCLDNSS
jgi:hypothetical protein